VKRLIAQLLAALVLAAVSLAGAAAGTAQAVGIGTDCLHPPDPTSPAGGVSGWIDPGPDNAPNGDPFAANSKVTIYEVYGYAGTSIVRYDDGCASAFNIWNDAANIGQGISSVSIALTTKLYRAVLNPAFGAIFDPIQSAATRVLGNGLFLPLIGVVLAAVGIYYAFRSRHGDLKEATGGSLKTFGIVAMGIACVVYPLTIGAMVDKGIGSTVSAAASISTGSNEKRQPADQLASAAVESVTYNTWLQATFGNGEVNSKAALEYGPRLFKAAAYSRAEQATIDKDPSKAQAMGDLKREHYKEIAKEIEDKYPDVYQWVAGNRQQSQAGFAAVGVVGALLAVTFLIYALFQIAYAMVIIRVAIGAGPALALIAAHPRGHHIVPAAGSVVLNALLRAVYFGVGAVLFTVAAIGTILNPANALDPIMKMIAMFALTLALYGGARKLGLEMKLRRKKPAEKGPMDYAGFDEEHRLSTTETFPSHTDPSSNRSAPIDLGYVQATSRRGAAADATASAARHAGHAVGGQAARGALGAGKVAAATATTARTGAAATVGGVKGAAKGLALTAATGGAAAPAAITGAARGAATAGTKSALRSTAAAAITKGTNASARPTRPVVGQVVYHPGQNAPRPGPAGRAKTGRVNAAGVRAYTVYRPKAGAK